MAGASSTARVRVAEAARPRAARRAGIRETLARGGQLAALSAFAFAQPLFDILGRNPAFFAVRGSTGREIVAFALVVALLPPLLLLAVELLAGLVSARLARSLHLLFVAALAAVVALQIARRAPGLGTAVTIAAAVAAGALVAWLSVRSALVRSLLGVLSPAPLVFLALFLLGDSIRELITAEPAAAAPTSVDARTPVVLIVFDEFSTVSLLDRHERIDRVRYPGFAALADDALWFRQATTVYPHTEGAVPAVLTGELPEPGKLPTLADHPRNIFTILGTGYRMRVLETLTHLCPPARCPRTARRASGGQEAAGPSRTESLASDAGVVYLHLVVPPDLERRLPSITDTWGNFGQGDTEEAEEATPACGRRICRFADLFDRSQQPTLYMVHSLLPHAPWQFLPTGDRYAPADDLERIPGIDERGRWSGDPQTTLEGYQRYLLQTGYADRGISRILKRLRETGLYDRALIVVTADHGTAFTPREPRRDVTPANLHEIAFVPLIVKLPRQRTGRIVDGLAETIDVVPTIAGALKIPLRPPADGRSLLGRRLAREATVRVGGRTGPVRASLRSLVARRRATLRRQIALFGDGSFERVYRMGPRPDLLGRRASELRRVSGSERVTLTGPGPVHPDPGTPVAQVYVTGRVTGAPGEVLAVAVDGVIRATTRSYRWDGATRFEAMLPTRTPAHGRGSLSVFRVVGPRGAPGLQRLGG